MESMSVEQVERYLAGWRIAVDKPVPAAVLEDANLRLQHFAREQAPRYSLTLDLIPDARAGGRLLEIGSAPYLMSALVRHARHYDVVHTNLSHDMRLPPPVRMVNDAAGETTEIVSDELNAEFDRFPYPDDCFDVALCCEVIEHLTLSPIPMLGELHRVLRPDGLLLVTTPNAVRMANLRSLMLGLNIYDRYRQDSIYGAYGRHNREYSPGELEELVGGVGFRVEHCRTVDIFPRPGSLSARLQDAWLTLPMRARSLFTRRPDAQLDRKGDQILLTARKAGAFRPVHPPSIFYPPEEEQVERAPA